MINFISPSFEETTSKEWLVANGIGGFASSSICGANTRRYHGLLVAASQPPTGRNVLVSKVEEHFEMDNGEIQSLSTNRYPGTVYPEGFRHLSAFERDPLPKAFFEFGGHRLSKTVFMRHGENTTVIEYENYGNKNFTLVLNPLLVCRDYHSLFREDSFFNFFCEKISDAQLRIFPFFGSDPLFIGLGAGVFKEEGHWYKSFEYDQEMARGLDYQEDAYSIGSFTVSLVPGQKVSLVLSTEEGSLSGQPDLWKQDELARLDALSDRLGTSSFLRDLIRSGDQFLVKRASTDRYTLIAGYPWFTDWGRDTMIAMRGLTIALGKKEVSESIIRTFLEYLDQGLIPNRFPDVGEEPEYNTIDATLWLFVVLHEYQEKFDDLDFIKETMPKLEQIIEAHLHGTKFNIKATDDGLMMGGEGLAQLTWMDARVGDYVVTPRHGCPVEVNALWFNALTIYNLFYETINASKSPYKQLARKTGIAFRDNFVRESGYLNDVVLPRYREDDSIRPNQVYAISLPFSPLTKAESNAVFEVVRRELYTPFGLRTLTATHPDFQPVYQGDQWHRDSAYHQGTVWPFLWGEYALAYLKTHNFSAKACAVIWEESELLRDHFYHSDCLHAISEIFDGKLPKSGKGCVQQAWSIGMMLRVFMDSRWKGADLIGN